MKTIKILSLILAALMLCGLVGCASPAKEATDKELYDIGKELIKIQIEMVKSDEYQTIIGGILGMGNSLRDTVIAGNYDAPSAVYSIELSNPDILMDYFSSDWKNLSETLKDQLRMRVSIANVISQINAQFGNDAMTLVALNHSTKVLDGISANENKMFLYVFENGTPIVVYYRNGIATSNFLFLDKTDTVEDIQAVFAPYKCDVERLDTNI